MNDRQHDHQVTILVVEDTAFNLRLLSSILKRQHYRVRTAKNGKTALLSVKEERPNLILLDINMPDMTGYEVCQHLKNDPHSRTIPVIFISALDEALDKVRAFNVGGVDYIPKPFQNAEVLIRVKNQLNLTYLQNRLRQANRDLADTNKELGHANNNLAIANQELESAYDQLAMMNDSLEAVNDILAQRNLELEQANSNLQQMTDKLERRVQKRTEVLEQVNQAYEHFFPQEMLKLFHKTRLLDLKLGEQIEQKIPVLSLCFYQADNSDSLACEQLHDYFEISESISRKYQGFVQSYHADGRVLLFFPRQVDDGLQAALEIQAQLINIKTDQISWGMSYDVQEIQITLVGTQKRMQLLSCSPILSQLLELNRINYRINIPLLITENVWLDLRHAVRYRSRLLTQVHQNNIFEVLDAENEQKQRVKMQSQPQFEQLVQRYIAEGQNADLMADFKQLKKTFPEDNSIDYFC